VYYNSLWTYVPLLPCSINWYRRKLKGKQRHCVTHCPCVHGHAASADIGLRAVSWRSVPHQWAMAHGWLFPLPLQLQAFHDADSQNIVERSVKFCSYRHFCWYLISLFWSIRLSTVANRAFPVVERPASQCDLCWLIHIPPVWNHFPDISWIFNWPSWTLANLLQWM